MASRLNIIRGVVRALGMFQAVKILSSRFVGAPKLLDVRPKAYPGVICSIRPQDSDLFVIAQVFGWNEYDLGVDRRNSVARLISAEKKLGNVPIIVDGGANVGYSALYFAETYPEATILAVEADIETYRILQHNCAGYNRIKPIHAALWSHDHGVELSRSKLSSWSHRVDDRVGSERIPSLRLDQVLTSIPRSRLIILKLDIEGAEREVCKASCQDVRNAPCVLVEPHDLQFPGAASLAPLYSAVAGKNVDTLLIGENLLLFDVDLFSI